MKNLYLKAGRTQDVFNYLKDNFNGVLTSHNDEYNLEFKSKFGKGNIKGTAFPDGMAYMEFDMILSDNMRLSMESLMTMPIFFAYCSQGRIQHSFGEQGERKIIKNKQSGILKSTSSVNSIIHFEKNIAIKFYVIAAETNRDVSREQNIELVKKLKNTFFNIKEDYLEINSQSSEVLQKIEELQMLTHKGMVRKLLINRIVEKIIETEIEQHTDIFSLMAESINSFALKQIDDIKRVSDFSLKLFTTDFLIQKAMLFTNNMQKEFKMLFSRTVNDFLIYIRIERGRI